MSTLTGQQINLTYPGLLNLETSTTGITSSYQQIQDGLGNNTNTRISTSGIQSATIQTIQGGYKPDYEGTGFGTGVGPVNVASTNNKIIYQAFYNTGFNSFSAITYNVGTVGTTSDVVTAAFYTAQIVNGVGIAPKDLIMSGITLNTATTGIKTTSLPSTLSFSGTGGGLYLWCFYVTNSGVTQTVRLTTLNSNAITPPFTAHLGFYINSLGTSMIANNYVNNNQSNSVCVALPFQTTYTSNDIINNIEFSITTIPAWGFGLKVIK